MNITELELKFKKYNKKYYYELCCPTIVNLYNECPSDSIGILLKRCFKIGDTIFQSKHIKIQYTNLTSNDIDNKNDSIENCLNIKLKTDPVEKNNKLCIKKLLLQVVPNCLNINEQQTRNTNDIQTVSFNLIGTMIIVNNKISIDDFLKNWNARKYDGITPIKISKDTCLNITKTDNSIIIEGKYDGENDCNQINFEYPLGLSRYRIKILNSGEELNEYICFGYTGNPDDNNYNRNSTCVCTDKYIYNKYGDTPTYSFKTNSNTNDEIYIIEYNDKNKQVIITEESTNEVITFNVPDAPDTFIPWLQLGNTDNVNAKIEIFCD